MFQNNWLSQSRFLGCSWGWDTDENPCIADKCSSTVLAIYYWVLNISNWIVNLSVISKYTELCIVIE